MIRKFLKRLFRALASASGDDLPLAPEAEAIRHVSTITAEFIKKGN